MLLIPQGYFRPENKNEKKLRGVQKNEETTAEFM